MLDVRPWLLLQARARERVALRTTLSIWDANPIQVDGMTLRWLCRRHEERSDRT